MEHILSPLWIPHLPIFGKKLTPGPLGPKKGPYGRSAGRFPATGPDFGPKIRFLLLHPKFRQWPVCNTLRDGRFGTFGSIFKVFVSELRTKMAQNGLILAIFGPKIRFLLQDPGFCQWPVCNPLRDGRFGTFGSIFKLFVSELRTKMAKNGHFLKFPPKKGKYP